MLLGYVWMGMLCLSVVCGCLHGTVSGVSAAAMEGAQSAVTLCIRLTGPLCVWSGLLELIERSGLGERLHRVLRPVLSALCPTASQDPVCAGYMAANVSSNLLGLGNAATPGGIRAVERMHALGVPEAELVRFVVLNTASIQLLPTTVASIRAGLGCAHPLDILPCVLLSSVLAVTAGLLSARMLEYIGSIRARKRGPC